jgi:hypothetical protein
MSAAFIRSGSTRRRQRRDKGDRHQEQDRVQPPLGGPYLTGATAMRRIIGILRMTALPPLSRPCRGS